MTSPSPRHLLIEQVLPQYRSWLYAVARDICGPTFARYHEDVAQEGYIAMWRAVGTFDPDLGAAPTYLTNAARMRMLDVARRGFKTWTGRESMRGSRDVQVIASVEAMTESTGFDIEHVLASVALDNAAWSYHHGEISEALAALTPTQREYVVARFWYGYEGSELDRLFGAGSRSLWGRAKPVLTERLRHLIPA